MSVPELVATSDVVIGLAVGIPVVVLAGGAAVLARLRRRARTAPGAPPPSGPPTGGAPLAGAPPVPPQGAAEGAPAPRHVPPPAEEAVPAPAEEAAPPPAEEAAPAPAEEAPTFRGRLGKARGLLAGYVSAVRARGSIDAATWDDLEEALIRADVGVQATDALLDDLRGRVRSGEIAGPDALLAALKADLVATLSAGARSLGAPARPDPGAPVDVWLFVGVNGVGKTTTVGKVAHRLQGGDRKVLLAAGDTFRAAAGEQLAQWAERTGADIVRGNEGGDPSAVVFDAVQRGGARGFDVVLADTAGRLHNKANLVEELKKIRRVADRPPGSVTEVLLVLDATTGQNGLAQAAVFTEAVDVTGVVLTKLDGTAKGGIVVAIQRSLGLPVVLVGLGEGPDDLVDFDPEAFVDALF
ncbi:MAG: signal recognition particle-docking protein FtsY [Actinomycetota bacterium]|nr:signal recognition particle-docking protein FtsY [Actinomycetota bacterium]